MNNNYEPCQHLKKIFLECIQKKTLSETQFHQVKQEQVKCQQFFTKPKWEQPQNWSRHVCALFSSS